MSESGDNNGNAGDPNEGGTAPNRENSRFRPMDERAAGPAKPRGPFRKFFSFVAFSMSAVVAIAVGYGYHKSQQNPSQDTEPGNPNVNLFDVDDPRHCEVNRSGQALDDNCVRIDGLGEANPFEIPRTEIPPNPYPVNRVRGEASPTDLGIGIGIA